MKRLFILVLLATLSGCAAQSSKPVIYGATRSVTEFPTITPASNDYWILSDTSASGAFGRVLTSNVRAALGLATTDTPTFGGITATGSVSAASFVSTAANGSRVSLFDCNVSSPYTVGTGETGMSCDDGVINMFLNGGTKYPILSTADIGVTVQSPVASTVDGSASITLTAAQVSSTIISNYGMGAGDVALTLPTAAAGYVAVFNVGTAQSNKWGVRAGANDKIYLLNTDGTISAGSDNGYARMTAAQVGQSFACWTFNTGASAWDWMCKAGAIGTSTFAAN